MDAKIIQLRELLRERFPGAHARSQGASVTVEDYESGVSCLDEARLSPGSMVELVTESTRTGGALVLDEILRQSVRKDRHAALVDGRGTFDPQSAGIDICQRLLWVRCRTADEALRSADLLLRDGNLPLILMDLQLNPVRELQQIRTHVWHRLAALAEESRALCCICTPCKLVPSARVRLQIHAQVDLHAMREDRAHLTTRLRSQVQRQRPAIQPQSLPFPELRRAG